MTTEAFKTPYTPITLQQLQAIMPAAKNRAKTFLEALNNAMKEYDINTPARQAAFLAQIAHESGQLLYVKELASGTAYEGRADLGNKLPGDGVRFKGRGLIQLTGRANYIHLMIELDIDCVEHPELLELPENACKSAAWFWKTHGLNEVADSRDFDGVSDIINRGRKTQKVGDANGYSDRLTFYTTAKKVLGVK